MLAGVPTDRAGLQEFWLSAAGDVRRALVRCHVDAVEIAPIDRRKPRRFDPDRITVRWRALISK